MTNTGADVQDLYILKDVSPDGTTYSLDNNPTTAFDTRTETIKVAGAADEKLNVRTSWWGPVVTDALDKQHYNQKEALALNFTAIDKNLPDTTLNAVRKLGSVSTWPAFKIALAEFVGPSQNFVFANKNGISGNPPAPTGEIGYALVGKVRQADPCNQFAPGCTRLRLGCRSDVEGASGRCQRGAPATLASTLCLVTALARCNGQVHAVGSYDRHAVSHVSAHA
jgi:hypothetical protein